MTYRGQVKGGVIVLEGGHSLPEGAQVDVALVGERIIAPSNADSDPVDDPLWTLTDMAVETGIPDLATNIDHYLYGHPKARDDKR